MNASMVTRFVVMAVAAVVMLFPANAMAQTPGVAAGDFNGDGFDDLAVPVPNQDVSGAADAGAVIIMYGSATGITATAPSSLIRVSERESGFFCDIESLLERLVPRRRQDRERMLLALLGPRTEQIPFSDGKLYLGQYQRIFLVAFEDECADEWMVTVVGAS